MKIIKKIFSYWPTRPIMLLALIYLIWVGFLLLIAPSERTSFQEFIAAPFFSIVSFLPGYELWARGRVYFVTQFLGGPIEVSQPNILGWLAGSILILIGAMILNITIYKISHKKEK